MKEEFGISYVQSTEVYGDFYLIQDKYGSIVAVIPDVQLGARALANKVLELVRTDTLPAVYDDHEGSDDQNS